MLCIRTYISIMHNPKRFRKATVEKRKAPPRAGRRPPMANTPISHLLESIECNDIAMFLS